MNKFYEELKHMDCNSVVLYIQGNSEADLQRKSKDIHRNLEENQLTDRLRITYLEQSSMDILFKHLLEDSYYQAQQYKALLLYPGNCLEQPQKDQLYTVMNRRNVKIFIYDGGTDDTDSKNKSY
ncbi:MAG: hypothetical protein HFI75_10455 [Lachnospiraceae bacterium]|nr:hypothetical protein [Lachnospiraceae bacterium]